MKFSRLGPHSELGMSLIEVVITLVVLAVLILLGAPSLSEWIQNSQIRTAAESTMSGLQAARNEAVRRNTNIEFRLTNPTATGGTGWRITLAGSDIPIQSAPDAEGSAKAIVTPTPGEADTVTFTGLGRTPDAPNNKNADGTLLLTRIDIDSSVLAADKSREMRILISTGGQIRMCDPNVSNTAVPLDPRACP